MWISEQTWAWARESAAGNSAARRQSWGPDRVSGHGVRGRDSEGLLPVVLYRIPGSFTRAGGVPGVVAGA